MDTALLDLFDAISRGDLADAQAALDAGADINGVVAKGRSYKDAGYIYSGATPLAQALRRGRMKVIDWVASKGADLEQPVHGSDPSILVSVARQSSAPKKVARLLKLGADPNVFTEDGRGALHYACSAGKVAAVHALLAAGARPDVGANDPNYGVGDLPTYTPLYDACVSRHTDCAIALLEAGADPNTGHSDSWLMSPLGMAIKHEDRALIDALLAHGARTDPPFLSASLEARMRAILARP
jgi:ankyrin repeat protein